MMHRHAIIKVDEEKKNVGEAKRKKKEAIVDICIYIYAALSSASTLLSERKSE
jgi:hypothetical protein